jgi:hypothetical protein
MGGTNGSIKMSFYLPSWLAGEEAGPEDIDVWSVYFGFLFWETSVAVCFFNFAAKPI